jgi:hypothetical protein
MKARLFLVLSMAWGLAGCYVYQPIEKTTRPENPDLSAEENLFLQLIYLNPGETILVTSTYGQHIPLEFQQISQDTLYADYRPPAQSASVKIPLTQIRDVKRLKFSKGLTFLADAFGFIFVTGINLLINGEVEYGGEEH